LRWSSPRLKVFDGKAVVSANGSKHKVKKKWSLAWAEPDSEPTIEKFDRSQKDSLDKWQGERVAALEAADLSDLKVRLISGSAALHVVSNAYLDGLSVHSGNALVRFDKLGVYRLDAPAGELLRLKVFDGKAVVSANGSKHKVKKKWSLAWAEPDSEPTIEKFDRSQKDSLDKWQGERVAALEAAERRKKGTACNDVMAALPAQIGTNQRRPGAQGDATTIGAGCKAR
jgi:uncharacterized protein YfaS (alpha-2-macroglobulin family)